MWDWHEIMEPDETQELISDKWEALADGGALLSRPTAVTALAALVLLICVMIYTSSYRKRGRPEDRLFFVMILSDMVTAVCDILLSFLTEGGAAPDVHYALASAVGALFDFSFTFTFFLFVLYSDAAFGSGRIKRGLRLFTAVPLILYGVVLLVNIFTGQLFAAQGASGGLPMLMLQLMRYGVAYLYVALMLIGLWRTKRKLAIVILILTVGRALLIGVVHYWISSIPFMAALTIIFAHICLMDESFYGEDGA